MLSKTVFTISSACFLESLDRPLTLFATSGILSVQPAVSLRSPRVFILRDNLVISVVPEGVNIDLLEFAYLVTDKRSIKGELEMPATDDIPEALNVKDSEILDVTVPAGGAITVVGTTFTFDPNDGTGTGYYILVVTNADP